MDVSTLKEKLVGDIEKITYLLEEAGFTNIYQSSNKIRCGYDDGVNNVSVSVETLSSVCFSRNINGDIFTLLQSKLNLTFYEAYQWVCKKLGYDGKYREKKIHLPFNSCWLKFSKAETYDNDDYEVLDKRILDQYKIQGNHLFLADNIDLKTQENFGCFYDVETDRFCVPWFDIYGQLIGIMGRTNNPNYEKEKINKWMPVISGGFNKSNHLFALNRNRDHIIEKDAIMIFESEKAPMQMESMGLRYSVASGGCTMNEKRANLIKGLKVKNIYLMYDEGLDEEVLKKNAKILKCNNEFYKNRVFYFYDKNNKYLPKGSKMSPSDLDYETFKRLIQDKECFVEV